MLVTACSGGDDDLEPTVTTDAKGLTSPRGPAFGSDGSTSSIANLNAWLAANPPHFIKHTNLASTDLEPGGVFRSMIAAGNFLYVVETNRDASNATVSAEPGDGSVLRIVP